MSDTLSPGESHRGTNGAAESARAHETVAHGRAHLDYQRRIATAGIHRDDLRVMRHYANDYARSLEVGAMGLRSDEAYQRGIQP